MHNPEGTHPNPVPAPDRADILHNGVPYVRGWHQALTAAQALAEELRALGLEDDFAYMRADVNLNGDGFIRLDLITTQTALRLITALTRGLCAELERLPVALPDQDCPSSAPSGPNRP